MSAARKFLLVATTAILMTSCGGGMESPQSTAATPPTSLASLRPQSAALAAVSPEEAARQLMDAAEGAYPQYFPTHEPTQALAPFVFRYYPATGMYLGVVVTAGTQFQLAGVYVVGGPFGDLANPTFVGLLSSFITPAPGAGAPGGLYVGYYAEDPLTNPEDPTAGALYLQLPAGDAAFSGAMYFTFVGCQSSNVGAISGTKSDTALAGNWSGTLDGSGQSGAYSGSFNANGGFFGGTYTVAGGKQFKVIPGCIEYFIAPGGTWEIAPVGTSVPSTFTLIGSGTQVSWTSPAGTALTLLSVIDEALAVTGSPNAAVHQTLSGAGAELFDLSSVGGLVLGRTYVVTVAAVGGGGQRVGVASIRMTR